jgi:hypothetical protein
MCASKQMIVVNNTKKRKLQYISLAYSDKLTPQIGAIPFRRLGQQWNRWPVSTACGPGSPTRQPRWGGGCGWVN